jgi:hypothetical protein
MRTAQHGSVESDTRWDRLQRFLFGLKPGQCVTVSEIAARTGLPEDSVDTVLVGLTRAALFHRTAPATFVRDSLQE